MAEPQRLQLSAEEKAAARKARKEQLKNEKAARKQKGSERPAENKPAEKGTGKRQKDIRLKSTFVNETPKGEKKDLSGPMPEAYDPPAVEAAWYDWWLEKGYFKPSDSEEKFVIVIPPPNVTGALHMGHALTNSIEDTLTRWHRMHGRAALWVPGTDHAGIATQTVVEKKLNKEKNLTRHDLGREKFIELVQEWKDSYQSRIIDQLKRLGSSLDWDRLAFTMDTNFTEAVLEAFIRLHGEGLIFRDNRLVNWCCALQSTISDLEVDRLELTGKKKLKVPGYDKLIDFGELIHFAYKVVDSEEEIVVATTRIETMVGDSAVAIHPDDERYKHLHGKHVWHPFREESIPIITDSTLVKMEFGTGAVKVTPAHDPNDYLCGKRNDLPFLNILNDDGTFNSTTGKFSGMRRYDVRYKIISELETLGLLRGRESHEMVLAICSRSGDIIEPTLKPQWWVNCESMAKDALEAVESGKLQLIPENPNRSTWTHYLSNIQPWCISRQLWWGHRIPAYRVSIRGTLQPDETEHWVVAKSHEEALQKAVQKYGDSVASKEDLELHQDPDVLDTWFSSGIFPIGVFGWPKETEDLKRFYPTSLLETGKDILFFWVMRMVMMCTKLTGELPFKQVFLHTMVRDAQGRKMSKTLGNVIDPVDVIEGITLQELHEKLKEGNLAPQEIAKATEGQKKDFPKGISECGTDAMRFALCSYTSQGTDINLDINKVVALRNFCNKLWNAVKFSLMNLGPDYKPLGEIRLLGNESPEEQWILSKLAGTISTVHDAWVQYDFTKITDALYGFWYDQLCSVFFEVSKPLFAEKNDEQRLQSLKNTLYNCVEIGLRLLHPFMPFVTEELWQRIPRRDSDPESIMIAKYPTVDLVQDWLNPQVEQEFELVQQITYRLRSIRASYSITPKTLTDTLIRCGDEETRRFVEKYSSAIRVTGGAQSVEITEENLIKGCSMEIINPNLSIFIRLEGVVDFAKESVKLQKVLEQLIKSRDSLQTRMESPLYANVPPEQRENDSKKLIELNSKVDTTRQALEQITELQGN